MKINLQARLEFLTGPLELTTVKTALEKLGYIVDYASVDYLPLITGMRNLAFSFICKHSQFI
jgi:hypothetical protein